MKKPLVSIITPCFNGENYLENYFKSILSQDYKNLEVVFINDGSTDRTEDMAHVFGNECEKKRNKIYIC